MENVLTTYYDYSECNIHSEKLNRCYEKSAKDILNDIAIMEKDSQDGDTIVFYYSGHGAIKNISSYIVLPNTKSDNLEETALSVYDLVNALSGNNKLNIIILDCCYSGQAMSLHNYNTKDIVNGTGVVVLSACKQNEKSNEYDSIEHGIFTYSLIEALKNFEMNKNITPQELICEVYKRFNSLKIENKKEQNIVTSSFIVGDAVLAKRCENYNEENIIEVLNNVEFLDKDDLLKT